MSCCLLQLDKRYEVGSEVRPQIRFLEDLDKIEKKRHEEAERVVLLRAAKVGVLVGYPPSWAVCHVGPSASRVVQSMKIQST